MQSTISLSLKHPLTVCAPEGFRAYVINVPYIAQYIAVKRGLRYQIKKDEFLAENQLNALQ